MALSATLYRFEVDLSDVDRGVYEQLELRPAMHPSESMPYLLTRVLAYCLSYEEGIAFSRGLAAADEPALWVKDLQGTTQAWIEVGAPSAERLHKAKKAVPRVAVFCHHDIGALEKAMRATHVHRAEELELYAVDPAFLAELAALLERNNRWSLTRSDADVYVTIGVRTLTTRIERRAPDQTDG